MFALLTQNPTDDILAIVFWVFAVLLLAVVVWVFLTMLDAKYKTKSSPRTAMFTCDKHGCVPVKYAVPFTAEGVLDEPILTCPMCMEDRFAEARKQVGLK